MTMPRMDKAATHRARMVRCFLMADQVNELMRMPGGFSEPERRNCDQRLRFGVELFAGENQAPCLEGCCRERRLVRQSPGKRGLRRCRHTRRFAAHPLRRQSP